MTGPNEVRAERLRRHMSVRAAASAGGISNTWWQRYEDGLQPLTSKITAAVSQAFGWPETWPVTPPSADDPLVELRERLEALAAAVERLTQLTTAQGAELAQLRSRRRQASG